MKQNKPCRCHWVSDDPLYIQYHDDEWGVPSYNDEHLFEMLILEGAQAGLSWITVLKKRENYRAALDGFNANTIANYQQSDIDALLQNEGIIRNKLKINSAIKNANGFLNIQKEFSSFANYLWSYVDHSPIINHFNSFDEVPVSTDLSERISKDLKKRGFSFVGPTIIYAYLQAVGVVMDHTTDCFRYHELLPTN